MAHISIYCNDPYELNDERTSEVKDTNDTSLETSIRNLWNEEQESHVAPPLFLR